MADEWLPRGPRAVDNAQPPASPSPDIMNDPAWDPSKKRKDKGTEDIDTCRICRGEGSPTEPLFYPCKCSGSIKFVHQECLMEWLSHSQKKHCELCKTSFRFTKLYDPQMPSTVPFLVFVKQGALHVLKSLLTWARWNLVILVWLGWVPWSMRIVWRSLFYLGDGGWITSHGIERRLASQAAAAAPTSPAGSGLPSPTTQVAANSFTATFGGIMWNPWSPDFAVPPGEPLMLRVFRKLFKITLYPGPDFSGAGSVARNATDAAAGHGPNRSPSLLSEYPFLNNLTRSAAVNHLAIDILEGQLITLLVVVGFILVFLIREWVVQQQPAVNAGLAVEAAAERDEQGVNPGAADQDVADALGADAERTDDELDADAERPDIIGDELADTWEQTANESDASEHEFHDPLQGAAEEVAPAFEEVRAGEGNDDFGESSQDSSQSAARPTLPHRGALTPASEIQRTLEEEALVSGQVWPGVDVFMDLWRRAESDPEEVLRIIRADGREHELSWIVSAMARLQHGLPLRDDTRAGEPSGVQGNQQGSANSSWFVVDEDATGPDDAGSHSHYSCDSAEEPPLEPVAPLDLAALHRTRVERRQLAEQEAPNQNVSGPLTDHPVQSSAPDAGSIHNVGNEGGPPVEIGETTPAASTTAEQLPVHAGTLADNEAAAGQPRGVVQTVQNWLWGDIPEVAAPMEDPGEDDEHVIENLADEPPFVPFANGQLMIENGNAEEQEEQQDPEVLQAAADAGINPNDVEAMEDGEDLEGILELIGAQGPLVGLIQNGLFSALLISISFIAGVWVPYVMGKVVLVFAANPVALFVKMPLRWISASADVIVDSLVFLAGIAFYLVDALVRFTATPVGWILPFVRRINSERILGRTAQKYAWKSARRLAKTVVESADVFSDSDVPLFSIVAHESLVTAQEWLYYSIVAVVEGVGAFLNGLTDDVPTLTKLSTFFKWTLNVVQRMVAAERRFTNLLVDHVDFRSFSLRINFDTPQRSTPIDYSLAHWSTQDRVIAILIGYAFFLLAGCAYLKFYTAANTRDGERPRGALIDILHQAGGVTKVILIISIEMIVFPLYCGALLDVALLPLFDSATIASRVRFTIEAPLTSTFIHWFIGTCYMFHFALFVSMCRRILRTGVLYFIRDPDDPSFHPVRDVLERNVYTQLRKIAFSAMVYGGLVIVCLGTVVWGLGRCTSGIFPIRWSSSGPVLESPVDLLVYNFVMPFAVTFSEPATVLHTVYRWWFRKCARWLRLTHFMFGERVEDEMYIFVRDPYKHIRLQDTTQPDDFLAEERRLLLAQEIASYYPNGHFVRAPASDQVRLPKGAKTFVPVDELGNRTDGLPDRDQGVHGRNNRLFKKIFIPHQFRLRIGAFLGLLWLFAAATGVGSTMVPLLFGRALFTHFFPPEFQVNDIYAFAVGAYLLGVPIYLAIRCSPAIHTTAQHVAALPLAGYVSMSTLRPVLQRALALTLRVLRLLYFYVTLGLLLPAMTGLLWEAYVVIPLLTLSHPLPAPPYTIRFVQSWTLAVVALKFATKVTLRRPESAAARALRALVSPANRGATWTDPDVRLATRAIVVPACCVLAGALALPPTLAAVALRLAHPPVDVRPLVYRYAYPAVLSVALGALAGRGLGRGLKAWRERVRDEVFLVGERLHNFGEKSAAGASRPQTGLERRQSQRVELE